ncbi:MAG: UDP-N-acetylmuramoyl-tripeptide--D-alanyl-D-alanine ligase [Oscillospiraceae bacterium]|nr:UDP-N-acetylmuramoyl-tripeptide--D-alanyl-D-alanine ligase [Oscillospiraceae bacterium]
MNLSMSIAEIAKAINGEIIYINKSVGDGILDVPKIKNISTDSRKILPESLFYAIKGEKADGHDFISQAIENGALGVVAESEKNNVKRFDLQHENIAIIAVKDTVQALLDTSKYYKSKFKKLEKTVAVTGSVGKTTTKEFIYSVLVGKFTTKKSEGNFNTEIGLPFTLFSLGEDTEALVLEMGMSGFGEIQKLSETANPNTAVITNIGTSHIEMLGSREGIKKAKFEILDGMSYDANIILNADEPLLYSEKNKTGKKEYFFGINNREADFTAENIKFDYEKNISEFSVKNYKYKIPAAGIQNVYDALPAIIVGKIYGLSNEKIQAGFNNFQNAKMRQNIYDLNGITIIDDCYNASLESVLAAFDVLSGIADKTNGRKIAVLSDILEAGDYSEEIHAKIGKAAAEKNISTYLFGEKSKATFDAMFQSGGDCFYTPDKSDIVDVIYGDVKKGDVILFKASRGMAMETVIEAFKNKFI